MPRKLKKGDVVVVISGDGRHLPIAKRTGAIIQVDKKKRRLIVEGINVRKISQKRSAQNPQGGFIERECPIHVSNVMTKERFDLRVQEDEEETE